jgi:putative endonuclease
VTAGGVPPREEDRAGDGEDRWWVYLLECEGGRLYTGIARDPERRFRAHASGKGARFTRSFPPVRLLSALPCEGRSAATRLEREIKALTPAGKRAFFSLGGEEREGGTSGGG